jgi:hypothetical protein
MKDISYSNVTYINELTKTIVRISGQVNLAALNAMLLSRKGGDKTVGFAAVTKELRKFTLNLERQMRHLTDSLNHLIFELSSSKRKLHTCHLMKLALENAKRTSNIDLQLMTQRLKINQASLDDEITIAITRVVKELDKSATVCNIGQNLAVLSKIESQTGDQYQAALANVSDTIDTIISNINDNLEHATRYANNLI